MKSIKTPILFLVLFFSTVKSQTTTVIFLPTGNTQTFVMPACTGDFTVTLAGGRGGSYAWGGGFPGRISAVLSSTPGTVLYINVGGTPTGTLGGFNGGGNGGQGVNPNHYGCGGGGATDIRINGTSLSDRIIVAAGGGGSGGSPMNSTYGGDAGMWATTCTSPWGMSGNGGNGYTLGGTSACAGGSVSGYGAGGNGGGVTSPGGAATGTTGSWGSAGALALGGNGGGSVTAQYGGESQGIFGAGGGGGGYYGGGGGFSGGYYTTTWPQEGGGGAGSSWINQSVFFNCQALGGQLSAGSVLIAFSYTSTAVSVSAPPNVCAGSSVTLVASGANTYTWNSMPGFIGGNSSTVSNSPLSSTVYSVSATNSVGCVSSTVVPITVLSLSPTITALSSQTNNSSCPGKTLSLIGAGALTYTWSGGISNNVPFVPTSSQSYTVTGSNGCGSGTAAITISMNPTPTISVVPTQTSICITASVALIPSGGVSYVCTNYSIAPFIPFTPLTSSAYTIIGTTAEGCSATAVTTVFVNNPPLNTPQASSYSVCLGSSTNLMATGANSYTWLPPNSNLASINVAPVVNTTYTLIQAIGGCATTWSLAISVMTLPAIGVSASSTLVCSGSSLQLSASGGSTYNWYDATNILIGSGSTISTTPFQTNTFVVSGSNGSCSANASIIVSVQAQPSIFITANSFSVCPGAAVYMTVSGANNYVWSVNNNTGNTFSIIPTSSTIISVTGTGTNGCLGTAQNLITVFALPNVNISSTTNQMCNGKSATLTANGAQSYTWQQGSSSSNTMIVTPIVSTVYSVTGTSSNGCMSGNTFSITVYTTTFIALHSGTCCEGQIYPVQLNGASNYTVNGVPSLSSFTLTPISSNIFTISASSIFNGYVCTSSQTSSINVYANPVLTLTSVLLKLCEGETNTISILGANSYSWSNGQTVPQFTYTAQTSQTQFTVTGTSIFGCSSTESLSVGVSKCTSLEEANFVDYLNIFPNPGNGILNIISNKQRFLKLYDLQNKFIKQIQIEALTKCTLNLVDIGRGMYLLVDVDTGQTFKFFVE